ncbi:NHL repeat-containing protein 2 [Phlebotomus papatasi]|uniref:NHL repeat-containing protein 2 n=1 Tax=Phlebotomus papatasi TaxID=29031 RepID=UPI002483CCD1|nr:NHL repeat-containing protein 2 [Phlebotomus papatasi]
MSVEEAEQVEMLDLLAYNCNRLRHELKAAQSPEEEEELLKAYLRKADESHQPIGDFKDDLDWFNVEDPLTLSETLQGKIVVLDFFTYCCINCMHILPDLKKLEEMFSVEDGLVVIGVHSAKFDNEKDSANILSAVQRYNITHPVVNDVNSSMWNELNVQCWPTLVVLGPKGNPLFVLMGEGHFSLLVKYIRSAVMFYKDQGAISGQSLPIKPSTDLLMKSNLKFPGKIVCSKVSDSEDIAELYAISDSGNHRVIVMNAQGEVLQKIGGKSPGFVDGNFKVCRFDSPQGLVFLDSDTIFVADTENHAIRKIDLKARMVETVVGTGKQGNDRVGGKAGPEQEISSPWDVAVYRTKDMDMSFHMDESAIPEKVLLLIAMAGTHQIWAYFIDDLIWWKFRKCSAKSCAMIAGNGNEENRNNAYPTNASFAQPSGLAVARDSKELFVADSESSCVRKLSLSDGKVSGVVGGERNPQNLFAFGDIDGKNVLAKLQHPLGVTYNPRERLVYVADTYNHKIKRIDPLGQTVTTLETKGHSFNEPGGLCVNPSGTQLFIADTNNHSIEILSLSTLEVKPLSISFNATGNDALKHPGTPLQFGKLVLKPLGGKIRLSINLNLEDIGFTEEAPQKWNVYLPNDSWYVNQQNGSVKRGQTVDIDITVPPANFKLQADTFSVHFKLALCVRSLCFPRSFSVAFPVTYDTDGLDCIIEDVLVKIDENMVKV